MTNDALNNLMREYKGSTHNKFSNGTNKNLTRLLKEFSNCQDSNLEFLAIVSNDESGIFQVKSFKTKDELDEYAKNSREGLNYVTKYIAFQVQ